MKTIALIAQKGGAGKTTLALNLAVAAEQDGKQAVIIDLDPKLQPADGANRRQAETPVVVDAQAARLGKALKAAEGRGVDLVIVDTPAHNTDASLEAAKLADPGCASLPYADLRPGDGAKQPRAGGRGWQHPYPSPKAARWPRVTLHTGRPKPVTALRVCSARLPDESRKVYNYIKLFIIKA